MRDCGEATRECVAARATIQCMHTTSGVNRLIHILDDESGHAVLDNLSH